MGVRVAVALQRFVVTGCNGVLGSALAARLLEVRPEAEVFGIDLTEPDRVPGIVCDLAKTSAVQAAIARLQPDAVFHCAGAAASRDITELSEGLLLPTHSLIKALEAEAPSAIFVLPGSVVEYGTLPAGRATFSETDEPAPGSPYGVVKVAQTGIALKAAEDGLDARVGRVFDLIGPGAPHTFLPQRIASQLALVERGEVAPRVEVGTLSSVRDYIDIRDACDGLLAVAERGVFGRIYNICTGVGRTAGETAATLIRCSGFEVEIIEKRRVLARGDRDASVGDPSRAARELKWEAAIEFETSACDAVKAAREAR